MLQYVIRRVFIAIPLLIVADPDLRTDHRDGDPLADWKLLKARTPAEISSEYTGSAGTARRQSATWTWAGGFVTGDWKTTIIPGNGTQDVRSEIAGRSA